MEALMVDLDEENEYTQNHEPQAPFDNIHPSVKDALQSPERLQWQIAMQAEINALEKNGMWSLVPRPNCKNIISCKWVLTNKFDFNEKLDSCKRIYPNPWHRLQRYFCTNFEDGSNALNI